MCSFPVKLFDIFLQDNTNPETMLFINSFTGEYAFYCGGTSYTGVGTITKRGCQVSLTHNPADRRVSASIQLGTSPQSATAALQSPPGTTICTITDTKLANNSCVCNF